MIGLPFPHYAIFRGTEEIGREVTSLRAFKAAQCAAEETPGERIVIKRRTQSGIRFYSSVTVGVHVDAADFAV